MCGVSKKYRSCFDQAEGERRVVEIIGEVPFVLRHSKHGPSLFSSLLESRVLSLEFNSEFRNSGDTILISAGHVFSVTV